jgi:hypothetical protein
MHDSVFKSAADRIAFSEAVDFIQQGRTHLVAARFVDNYVAKGLLAREGDGLVLTELGRKQHELAQRERFSDG